MGKKFLKFCIGFFALSAYGQTEDLSEEILKDPQFEVVCRTHPARGFVLYFTLDTKAPGPKEPTPREAHSNLFWFSEAQGKLTLRQVQPRNIFLMHKYDGMTKGAKKYKSLETWIVHLNAQANSPDAYLLLALDRKTLENGKVETRGRIIRSPFADMALDPVHENLDCPVFKLK